MDVVAQDKPLSMDWCLECHRAPETALRPLDKVTDLGWHATPMGKESIEQAQENLGKELQKQRGVNPPVSNCAGCHR